MLERTGRIHDESYTNKVIYQLKKDEWSKIFKLIRTIGNMQVAASLETFRSAKFLKSAMSKTPILYKGCLIEFCAKPSPDRLDRIMKNLAAPMHKAHFVFFSDDSSFAVRTGSDVRVYNLDISSCDASHRAGLFKAAYALVPNNMADAAFRASLQTWLPIEVRNPQFKQEKFTLEPTRAILYSGHGWTTFYNNVANMLIAFSIIDAGAVTKKEIVRAAFNGPGYRITCDDSAGSATFDHLDVRTVQFLKNSPCFTSRGLRSVFNFGVWLRIMGTTTGDFPGTGPIEARCKEYTKAVFNGMFGRVSTPLLDGMRALYESESPKATSAATLKKVERMLEYKSVNRERIVLTDEQLFARYQLKGPELSEMVHLLTTYGYGWSLSCVAMSKILAFDYGLSCTIAPQRRTGPSMVDNAKFPVFLMKN